MSLPQGINFRATAGFVTDTANCDKEIGTTANYPRTSVQGNTVGWEDAPSGTRDRSAYPGTQSRVSGVAFNNAAAADQRYRIDLPSTGNYKFRLGLGDVSGNDVNAEIFDTTTSLVSFSHSAVVADKFYDGTDVLRTSHTDWDTNEALSGSFNFSTTICRIKNKRLLTAASVIAHFWIESAAAADTLLGQAML